MERRDALRDKLETFIRKYYQNRLIKGLIYGLGLGLSYWLALSVAEYFGRFGSTTRLTLLILLLAGLAGIVAYYILYPLSKLMKLGKRISYQKAARIIGTHFPEVDDKILNTLQLQSGSSESDLLRASIDQRIARLSPVPFSNAIDLKQNSKYWPILVIPMLIFGGILLSGRWDVVSESNRRLAAYDREFLPKAPFSFLLRNDDLKVEQGGDIVLELDFEGSSVPAEAEILLPSGEARMIRNAEGGFQFSLNNVQEVMDFRFRAAGFVSESYELEVLAVPQVKALTLTVVPPAYTGIKAFETEAKSVQDIPEGSRVNWQLMLNSANSAYLLSKDQEEEFERLEGSGFSFEKRVVKDMDYSIRTRNADLSKLSVSGNRLRVVKDEFPEIKIEFNTDTNSDNIVYYSGVVSDDYGFSGLRLVMSENGSDEVRPLSLSGDGLVRRLSGVLALDSLAGEEESSLRIFVEVLDNDGVNGPKRARSSDFNLKLIGNKAKKEQIDKDYQKFFKASKESESQQEDLQKALEKLKKELMERKSLSFQDKSKIKELLEKQRALLEKQKRDESLMDEVLKKEDQLKKKSEEVKKKEEQIDKIDAQKEKELDELMKDIEALMEKLDIKQLMQKLDELQRANEQNQKATDRKDDLLKDLKFQKDLLDQMDKLEQMSEKMEELSKQEESKKEDGESGESEEQKKVEKELEEVQKKIEEMKKENKAFEEASKKEELENKGEEAQESMQEAQENLNKNKQQKANEGQQKAGEKMKEMSQGLENSMMQMQSKSLELNMATLRQILENLETLSFDVESLSDRSKKIEKADPSFKDLLTEQRRLKDGAKVIEDSLLMLSKKVPEIEQTVFEELDLVKSNLDKSIDELEELRNARAAGHQQYVMTSANNLALMLDQSLRQMQQMAAQSKPGSQQCQKPGNKPGSKPGKAQIRKMQQGLGEKMDRMKNGKKDAKGKDQGQRGLSGQEIVEMISQQEQLRQTLEELSENEGNSGSKGNLQKAIEQMKELERELLNGELSPEYRERLREIESRLLESEKAEREQKKDEQRESEEADDIQQLYLEELEKYLREKGLEDEVLDRLPLDFRNYYKSETTKYFRD